MPEPAASRAVLDVRDLAVSFTRQGSVVRAVRGVDLTVQRGEIVGLVGESGSGKSALAQSVLGLTEHIPRSVVTGLIEVDGVEMLAARQSVRRKVLREHLGAVFQDPMTSLNPSLKISRQMGEVCASEAEAIELLRSVGLSDAPSRMSAFPHQLSGGQRQRVMIAMALAGDPSLLIADEPTTALDVTVQAQILKLLKRLCTERGCSLLLITHDLGVAAEVAHRIMVMYAGRIVEIGRTEEVLESPRHPYTRGLLASRLRVTDAHRQTLPTLKGLPPDPCDVVSACSFAPRCSLREERCEKAIPALVSVDRPGAAACFRWDAVAAELPLPARAASPTDHGRDRPSPRVTEPVVHLEGLGKVFVRRAGLRGGKEELTALKALDLEVRAGECLAVVGESGSGKSTLLRVIVGLIAPSSGRCVLAPQTNPRMVFQDAASSLTPWLTVGELIGEQFRAKGTRRREREAHVTEALARVGLPAQVAEARPRELSGGQSQRVALARAVAAPSKLLLADEPTSALDVSLAASVINLIAALRVELSLAVVFVTHDLAVAKQVSERVAVMYRGEIVEIGATEAVIHRPQHPYTQALLSAVPGAAVDEVVS